MTTVQLYSHHKGVIKEKMKKHIIKDFDSLKNYFRTIERPFFAVNKYPYNPLIGIENLVNNFEVLAFLNSKEAEAIA